MNQHTPGPWSWRTVQGSPRIYSDFGGHPLVVLGPEHGGQLALRNGDHLEVFNPDSPNARLIVAAPEILAALEQALEESGWDLSGPVDWHAAENGEPKWVCNARAVIAKARCITSKGSAA